MTYTESRTRTYFLSHDSQAPAHAQAEDSEEQCTCLAFDGIYAGKSGVWYCISCHKPTAIQ